MSSFLLEKKLFAFFEDRSLKHFAEFFLTKTPKFKPLSEPFYELNGFQDYFSDGEKLGEIFYEDEGKRLLIAGFKSTKELSERSSKKRQFELAKKILKAEAYDAGIFIFYDLSGNFRMSLVYEVPAGRRREYSDYRRYTYFVEQNEPYFTFLKQVGNCEFSSLEKIIEAFSVEPLTKQFYQEIANWYFWAFKNVKFSSGAEAQPNGRNIALIRLITRLMFIWFLKKRNLIPDVLFDEEELNRILKNFNPLGEDSTYYKAILQNLFFATLSCKQEERRFAEEGKFFGKGIGGSKDFGNQYAYRFKELFAISEEEILALFKDIPFLNGGLFESLDDKNKNFYIDGFTRRKKFQPHVPNFLFFTKSKRVDLSKDYGEAKYRNAEVRGIINIFKSYNFTIDESSPVDVEVALDPEMLGRVFENLLASYNPETATTARKATGSYYTPREIVDYMVEESLKEYFKTQIPEIDEEKLEQLFSFSDEHKNNPFDEETTDKLISAIDNLKVLDPAVGSGAFPMGVLHKLVFILQKLDPENKKWFQKQLEKANEIPDPTVREETLRAIEEKFKEKELDYGRKLYIIQNCLYGVDIQPIAIQICKLRFFISLLVDEKIDRRKPNYGIEPLPNLETNFVCANTLIGLDYGKNPIFKTAPEVRRLEEKIRELRKKYFTAYTPEEKEKIRKEDEKLRSELAEVLKKKSFPENSAKKIAEWDPYDSNRCADWFDPEWMFGVEDGFDIVIGNPPYIKEYTNRSAFDGLRESSYYQGKMDIWYLFACKGIDLLKNKGILTFIAQNNWVTSYGASKMRNKVIKDTRIIQLVDFGSYFIFESSDIQTMIMIFQKDNKIDNYTFKLKRLKGENLTFQDVLDMMNGIPSPKVEYLTPLICRKNFVNKKLNFSDSEIEKILNKIKQKGNFYLEEKEITNGIHCHYDFISKKINQRHGNKFKVGQGIFVLSEDEKKELNLTPGELKLLKPYYTSQELHRYYGDPKNKYWIIYTDSRFKNPEFIKPYPNIKKHLDRFREVITSDNKPYGLHRARKEDFFKGEKIVALRKCPNKPIFTYIDFDCYISAAFYVIKTNRINLKYLTGLLNSKLIAFWLKHRGKMQGNNYQIDKEPLLNLPLIDPSNKKIEKQIEILVDEIIHLKQTYGCSADTTTLETKIDRLVYKLYGLTEEEIEIIEKNVS